MKISVVTPSFNQGQFIEECIESVLAQNHEDFEHIIIDAGSTDSTLEVLQKYPHLKWISEPDDGQCDAINKGVQKATGDYILWLNADDYMMSNAFNEVDNVVSKNKTIDFIYGHVCFLDENTNEKKISYHIPFLYSFVFFSVYSLPSTGSFIKASVFKANPLDLNFHMVMDTEWVLRTGRSIKTRLLNQVLVTFRVSDDNKTAENIKHGFVSDQHLAERKRYKEMHIDSTNRLLSKNLFRLYLKCGHSVFKFLYYMLKAKSLIMYKLKFILR
tara:strand:- start:1682 stop:2497 length:816 start_codon:yes stop_codon:yes gene_type:complete